MGGESETRTLWSRSLFRGAFCGGEVSQRPLESRLDDVQPGEQISEGATPVFIFHAWYDSASSCRPVVIVLSRCCASAICAPTADRGDTTPPDQQDWHAQSRDQTRSFHSSESRRLLRAQADRRMRPFSLYIHSVTRYRRGGNPTLKCELTRTPPASRADTYYTQRLASALHRAGGTTSALKRLQPTTVKTWPFAIE